MSNILTVNKMVTPSVGCWLTVIEGMRLPMNSGNKMDSFVCDDGMLKDECWNCPFVKEWIGDGFHEEPICLYNTELDPQCILGEKDYKLALNLIKAGSSDRKYLRQLPIVMEVKADQVFWRQADTYKIGTTTNSSSMMHMLHKTHFTIDDFNINQDNMTPELKDNFQNWLDWINMYIDDANRMKQRGNPDWKIYWDLALKMVPESVYYTKCWSINYETAITIGLQRENHKNPAWDILINYWKEHLPYYKEFLETAKSKQNELKKLKEENGELEKNITAFSVALNDSIKRAQELEVELDEVRQERDNMRLDATYLA